MTSPNIEMIASSLRHCSLNGGGGRRSRARRRAEGSDDSEGVTVELNSEVALPYHWQQCLDIRTGQVYYINWEDGTRTTVDPRTSSSSSPFSSSPTPRSTPQASPRAASTSSSGASGYTSASSVGAGTAAAWFSGAGYGGYGYNDSDGYNDADEESSSSSQSSAVSSFSPTDESASSGSGSDNGNGNNAVHVLVAAGCRACFMYFMVPKSTGVCPKCGTPALLYLGRSGSNNNNAYA